MSGPRNQVLEDDDAVQAAVIRHLIDVRPAMLSREDLIRELAHPSTGNSQDDIELAIRELGRIGLLEEAGERISPSRAAVRYRELSNYMAGP